jgi:hypothetical protein
MCPSGGGYGEYIIMHIGPDGTIANCLATISMISLFPQHSPPTVSTIVTKGIDDEG